MSTNQNIDFSEINYAYDTHTFISSGETITSTNGTPITIDSLLSKYKDLFGERTAGHNLKTLLETLGNILGLGNNLTINDINDSNFYASAKSINNKTIDGNCLEGYQAYSFYLEKIILLLNKLNDAIEKGQAAIEEISNLKTDNMPLNQTVEEYVNGKVHELSAELYMADEAIAEVKAEFESCLKYNIDTKSWDKSSYEGVNKNFTKPSSLDNLRGLQVAVSNANDPNDKHKIACFSELNLLDRLRYIRYYYEIVLGGTDSDYQVFPNDSEKGYPCIPNKKSNTATRDTENMGGFELFYVGYLVDRDGSIDAYSSCLEAKSKAITDNISLQSEHIEAYNQYLAFINRAAQLFNRSQAENKATPIPDAASVALSYLCGGTMRDLIEVKGNKYIVIPATDISDLDWEYIARDKKFYERTDETNGLKYNASHVYMLVQADEKGMDVFLGNSLVGGYQSNGLFKSIDIATILANFPKPTSLLNGDHYFASTANEDGLGLYSACEECKKFEFTEDKKYATIGGDIYKYKGKTEILIWDLGRSENNEGRGNATDLEKQYLPTQLTAEEILPQSVIGHFYYRCADAEDNGKSGDYRDWGWAEGGDNNYSAELANRAINAWTTAFSNKSEYINTAIETINTDITALRTKMDTLDSLCSTLRNRSFETKKQLVSNLRS